MPKFNYIQTLEEDYGISSISQVVVWGREQELVPSLIQRVKDAEAIRNRYPSMHTQDDEIRYAYAWQIARRMNWSHFDYETTFKCKSLFVKLRMAKVWAATDVSSVETIIRALEKAGIVLSMKHSVWFISYDHVVDMVKKGMHIQQIVRLLKMVDPITQKNHQKVTSTHKYWFANGCHVGEWFDKVIEGISHSHVKFFSRFMRTFKHTHKISPHITARVFTGGKGELLNSLSEEALKMTVTDSRNWPGLVSNLGNNYNNRFRLNVVVRTHKEWVPFRINHIKDMVWLNKFKRVPSDPGMRDIPNKIIEGFNKKSFGSFVEEYKRLFGGRHSTMERSHDILALAKLHLWFGSGWNKTLALSNSGWDAAFVIPAIHDLGINLPETVSEKGRVFLKRYTHKWVEAVRVVNNWQLLIDQGIDPLAKEGLKNSLQFLASIMYDRILDIPFAQECAKWGYSQDNFEDIQKIWVSRRLAYSSIPKISLSEGDWKFYLLDRDDPRGPFLGEYTGCCQHPNGPGASCALHGASNPDGGFVVLEHQGTIKFQSWVWRSGSTLVFDNIEGQVSQNLYNDAKITYLKGIKLFRGRLGIEILNIGTGGSDISYDDLLKTRHREISAPDGYTDSHSVWEVTV